MHHAINIYRCYADDADAAIEVKARDREQAERIAAKQLRCEPGYVIARYRITRTEVHK